MARFSILPITSQKLRSTYLLIHKILDVLPFLFQWFLMCMRCCARVHLIRRFHYECYECDSDSKKSWTRRTLHYSVQLHLSLLLFFYKGYYYCNNIQYNNYNQFLFKIKVIWLIYLLNHHILLICCSWLWLMRNIFFNLYLLIIWSPCKNSDRIYWIIFTQFYFYNWICS